MVPKNRPKKRGVSRETEFPEGMNVLWNYNCMMLFLFLFILFLSSFSIFFGVVVEGTLADLLHLAYFLAFFVVLFGLTYHKAWVYRFMLGIYYYWIANIFATFIFGSFIEEEMVKSYLALFSPVMLLLFVVNLIIIWYLWEKRDNFLNFTGTNDKVEVVFKHIMVFFYISVIFLLLFGIGKMAQIPLAKDHIGEHYDEVDYKDDFCETKDENQDICYLLKAKVYGEKETCLKIEDHFYNFLCMKLVSVNDK